MENGYNWYFALGSLDFLLLPSDGEAAASFRDRTAAASAEEAAPVAAALVAARAETATARRRRHANPRLPCVN